MNGVSDAYSTQITVRGLCWSQVMESWTLMGVSSFILIAQQGGQSILFTPLLSFRENTDVL